MAQHDTNGYPFDSVFIGNTPEGFPQGDRDGSAADLAAFGRQLLSDGVVPGGMAVTNGGALSVNVAAGTAVIRGRIRDFGAQTLTLEVATATQVWNIIVRLDLGTERRIWCFATTAAPVRTDSVHDLVIAKATVNANTALIASIQDTRQDASLCGYTAIGGAAVYPPHNGIAYGTCATAASTTAKVGDVPDFVRHKGCIVGVKFSYANTASSPTLNVNGTGAAAIYDWRTNTYPVASAMAAGTHLFQYNGSQWVLLNPITVKGDRRMQVFKTSNTFVAPRAGNYKVRVQAAGGRRDVTASANIQAIGVGGGVYAESIVTLTAGQAVTVTVGTPGNPSSFGSFVSAACGAAYGNNTMSGTGDVVSYGGSSDIGEVYLNLATKWYLLMAAGSVLGQSAVYLAPVNTGQAGVGGTGGWPLGYGTGRAEVGIWTTNGSIVGGYGIILVEWVE